MTKTVVYSCVTGKYDKVMTTILGSTALPEDDVSYVLFSDQHTTETSFLAPGAHTEWSVRPPHWKHPLCQRRTARWHKLNSHVLFPDAEFVVWFDGSQRIKPIEVHKQLVLPNMAEHDIATFKHPDRTCVYQELAACTKMKKDNVALMRSQMDVYRKAGYPTFNGMVETACLVRRHSAESICFNKLWWGQLQNYSYRDQLSFNYVAWQLDLKYGRIPGRRDTSDYCDFIRHGQG
jgi:hypothetical protein